jgi:FAD/FMN-containing dehydrogenase
MSKVAHYLQEHVTGEVIASASARRYFATDASIFSVMPALAVYPRDESDVRKTARFTWQLAERGRVIPITARGAGTDQTGAALGEGIIMAFPAHMHHVIALDEKSGMVSVQPGANYGKVQQTLQTHGRFLPPYPASLEYSTIGGAVANNAVGEKSVKYGAMRDYVRGLRVVLANGEVIETGRLSKRELSKKLGLSTFEGEIYRALDTLLEENAEKLEKLSMNVATNSAGYALADVRRRDGSFDLTPLIVGSQGTLGIVTQIALETELHNPQSVLFAAHFDDLAQLQHAILELRDMHDMPSAVEMVDGHLLAQAYQASPNLLKDVITPPFPKAVLLVEFDDPERAQKKIAKKAGKILERYATNVEMETEPSAQERLWRIRHSSAAILGHTDGQQKSVPVIEDGIVPVERFEEYLKGIYAIFANCKLEPAVWGHAGSGNLHMQPFLDLSQVGDRQKVFRLMEDYYNLVISLGGSVSGEHGDGRLRGPYLARQYSAEVYALFQKVKHIFDPYGTMNPGVKVNITLDTIKPLVRQSYTLDHLAEHLPQS